MRRRALYGAVISRGNTTEAKARADGWRKATRAQPLWAAKAGRTMLQRVNGGEQGGRFFDHNGLLRGGLSGGDIAKELWSAIGSSDLYRIANPVADREESDRPFEENVWVRAACKAVAEGFQRLKFCVYPGDPANDVEPMDSHPLKDLLVAPNRVMTERQFWRAHSINMKHDGECVWFMMDRDGAPIASNEERILLDTPHTILPVRGDLVEVKYDKLGMPMSYRYTTAFSKNDRRVSREFPVGAICHFRDFDPYNVTRGLGDVDALERETDLYFQAFRAMDASVRNGGDPGGFIIYDHEVDAAEMERRQEIADEEFAGPNQRRIKLLQSSAKYVANPTKPSDMQYQELLTWLRDSILAGLGVPPPVVGVYDSATYNNVETAHREMFTGPNGILALASSTADVINGDLLPRMARLGVGATDYVMFDASGIEALQEDVGDRLKLAADIASKGIGISFNEGLIMQGATVTNPEEGDRRWVSPKLTTIEDFDGAGAGEGEPEPPAQVEPDDEELEEDEVEEGEVEEGEVEEDEVEDEEGEQASRRAFVSEEKVDSVYRKWRSVVNMGASELEAWGKTECSKKASLNPAAVIKRNVNLMRKKKAEWGAREVRAANRAISFISRMSGMPKGKPVGDCPSKRDISLKNWGFDPNKGRNQKAVEAEQVVAFARTEGELTLDKPLAQRVEKWLARYEKEQLTLLRRIANNGLRRYSVLDESVNPAALSEEAWSKLLLDKFEWAEKLSRSVRVALRDVFAFALQEAAGEIDDEVISVSDADVVAAIAEQVIKMAEGVTAAVTKRVRNRIAKVLVNASPPGNLRQVIKQTLPALTEELRQVFGTKDARAATIAQTETGRAVNTARFKQYQHGNVEEIMWIASQDEATRASHLAAHGTVVKLGGRFDNGLRHPHDPDGAAGEVINCRCTYRVVSRRDPLDDPDLVIE